MRITDFSRLAYADASQVTLKNCSVVIDGQNYFHDTYEKSKCPFVFGCDANRYAEKLRNYLRIFKLANIKCYVVLKGGDTKIETKIKKFKAIDFYVHVYNKEYVPPVLMKEVYRQVLDEMGIDFAICVTESKDECVALAQKLRCPVISFDVEYCFKKATYVPLPTISFHKETSSILCNQYKLQDFLKKHLLTEEKFAIFATLSDALIFPDNYFDSLLQTWGVLDKNPSRRYTNLFQWLSKNNLDEIRESITKALRNDVDKTNFFVYYDKILDGMRKDETGIVSNYLLNSGVNIVRRDAKWFEKGVASKAIALPYINLYKWKVLQGSAGIKDTSSEDSILLSIDIIKYAYNLLTNFKTDNIKVYQSPNAYVVVNTEDPNVSKPTYICRESVFENGWFNLKDLKLFEHFLKENKIKIEELEKVPVEATVLFAALVYYARKKLLNKIDVTREVYAHMISYVMINIVFDKEGSYRKLKNGINKAHSAEAVRVTEKYFNCSLGEAKRIFDGNVLKRLVELQYCMLHMNYLNTLCGSPYKYLRFHRMHNATFIYKILCDMPDDNIDVFIEELFKTVPPVLKFVKNLIKILKKLLK